MWCPFSLFFVRLPHCSGWGIWAGGMVGTLQGVVSAIICLTKPDILEAVLGLFRCKCFRQAAGHKPTSVQASDLAGTGTNPCSANTWGEESQQAYDVCAVVAFTHSDREGTSEEPEADVDRHAKPETEPIPEVPVPARPPGIP
jgi:hypothetical protein